MPEETSPDDDVTNDSSTDDPVGPPESHVGRPAPRADPAQQFLTWAVLVLIAVAAVVFGISLANQEPETPTGRPTTPVLEALR